MVQLGNFSAALQVKPVFLLLFTTLVLVLFIIAYPSPSDNNGTAFLSFSHNWSSVAEAQAELLISLREQVVQKEVDIAWGKLKVELAQRRRRRKEGQANAGKLDFSGNFSKRPYTKYDELSTTTNESFETWNHSAKELASQESSSSSSFCLYRTIPEWGDGQPAADDAINRQPNTNESKPQRWNYPMSRNTRRGEPLKPDYRVSEGGVEERKMTELDNEAKKLGQEYALDQCSSRRIVICPPSSFSGSSSGEAGLKTPEEQDRRRSLRKGRALILYMVQAYSNDDRVAEMQNFAHFLQFGLGGLSHHGKGEGNQVIVKNTFQMYDAVDVVIFRIRESVQEVTKCSELEAPWGTLNLYFVPPMPCDLCGHHHLLKFFGFKDRYSKVLPDYEVWPWKTVIMMNSGAGGPYFAPGWSSWIDILSMAGEKRRPAYWSQQDLDEFTTIGANSISWQFFLHAPSYCLAVPLSALSHFYNVYAKGCNNGDKWGCVVTAELRTLDPFLKQNPKMKVYSFTQDFSIQGSDDWEVLGRTHGFGGSAPALHYQDPCLGIFLKLGGETPAVTSKKRAVYNIVRQMRFQQRLEQQKEKQNMMKAKTAGASSTSDTGRERLWSQHGYFPSVYRWLKNNHTGCQWFRSGGRRKWWTTLELTIAGGGMLAGVLLFGVLRLKCL